MVISPSVSVRSTVISYFASRSRTFCVGWPYVLYPTEMTAVSGVIASRSSLQVDVFEPWCATNSTSASGIGALAMSAFSALDGASPRMNASKSSCETAMMRPFSFASSDSGSSGDQTASPAVPSGSAISSVTYSTPCSLPLRGIQYLREQRCFLRFARQIERADAHAG